MTSDEKLELIKQHEKLIYKIINKFKNLIDMETEDLYQEAVLSILQLLDKINLKLINNISGLIKVVIFNHFVNLSKSQVWGKSKKTYSSAKETIDEELFKEIFNFIDLTDFERNILLLKIYHFSNSQIAELIGTKRQEIDKIVNNIKEKFLF